MEAAQALYGVTMQEPGVSRLVSVKFNAARSGGVAGAAVTAVHVDRVAVPKLLPGAPWKSPRRSTA